MFKWLPDVLRRLAGRLAGRLPHGPCFFEIGKGGDRPSTSESKGPGIDLRCGPALDRRRADLGLLYLADHPDGRGDHPQVYAKHNGFS